MKNFLLFFGFLIYAFVWLLGATPGAFAQTLPTEVDGLMPPPLPTDLALPEGTGEGEGLSDATSGQVAPEQMILEKVAQEMKAELERLDSLDKGLPSLFFTRQELADLQVALAMASERGDKPQEIAAPADAPVFDYVRVIGLGGIVLRGEGDWIVWLNNQRLTPNRLPPEVKEIRVYKDYVEMKWMDPQSKKVVPVRLRPNQRFNLDTMGFLPG